MILCNTCGNPLEVGTSLCATCGAQAPYDRAPAQPIPPPRTNNAPTEVLPAPRSEITRPNRNPLATYIVIALLVLIAGVGLVAVLRLGVKDTSTAERSASIASNVSFTSPPSTARPKSETEARRTLPSQPSPKILSREEWRAKDAVGNMQLNRPQRITIHHTASPQQEGITIEKKMQGLQNFSQSASRLASGGNKRAWPDVPHHYYIAVDGQIAEGRDIKYVGDNTNTDYDPSGHILIVLEGNFEKEQPTSKQVESLLELVAFLSANSEIPVSEIKGHNDYASTACPGVSLKNALPVLRQKVADIRGKR